MSVGCALQSLCVLLRTLVGIEPDSVTEMWGFIGWQNSDISDGNGYFISKTRATGSKQPLNAHC